MQHIFRRFGYIIPSSSACVKSTGCRKVACWVHLGPHLLWMKSEAYWHRLDDLVTSSLEAIWHSHYGNKVMLVLDLFYRSLLCLGSQKLLPRIPVSMVKAVFTSFFFFWPTILPPGWIAAPLGQGWTPLVYHTYPYLQLQYVLLPSRLNK